MIPEPNLHQEVSESKVVPLDIDKLTDKIISSFCNLDKVFEKAPLQKQRHILCSLFPEKIDFEGVEHRTPRTNVTAKTISLINNEIEYLKINTAPDFQTLYQRVVPTIEKTLVFVGQFTSKQVIFRHVWPN